MFLWLRTVGKGVVARGDGTAGIIPPYPLWKVK